MLGSADILLLILGTSNGPLGGRTVIQKIAYFVSVKAHLNLGYKPHYYGPYSPILADVIEHLATAGYLTERPSITANNRVMYTYSLTEDGNELTNEIQNRDKKTHAKVRYVVDRCHRIANNNANILSWAAKVHFLLSRQGNAIGYEDAIKTGKEFGWDLSRKEIDSGGKLLIGMGLARKSKPN